MVLEGVYGLLPTRTDHAGHDDFVRPLNCPSSLRASHTLSLLQGLGRVFKLNSQNFQIAQGGEQKSPTKLTPPYPHPPKFVWVPPAHPCT